MASSSSSDPFEFRAEGSGEVVIPVTKLPQVDSLHFVYHGILRIVILGIFMGIEHEGEAPEGQGPDCLTCRQLVI